MICVCGALHMMCRVAQVYIAVDAARALAAAGTAARVVSMPSWELFAEQPIDYRASVFPDGAPVLSIEASATFGWERYAHAAVGMTTFGTSAPYEALYEEFGFTPAKVAARARAVLEFYAGKPVPSIVHRA